MSRLFLRTVWRWAGVGAVAVLPCTVRGAFYAAGVVDYVPGDGGTIGYPDPNSALGPPAPLTGVSFGFPSVLSPFSPAFDPGQIVQITGGGHLTLRLDHYALPLADASKPEIGVVENVGLVDSTGFGGIGATDSIPTIFGTDAANVEVSADGVNFVGLDGSHNPTAVLFNMPAVYYLNAGPYDSASPASPVLADFGKPFAPAGGLSALADKASYADVLAVFNGSGGGTWFDISNTGLSKVGYVRFSMPVGSTDTLEVDSVSVGNEAVGAAVPEPSGAAVLMLGAAGFLARRRSR